MSRQSTIEVRAARAFALKNYALAIRHLDALLEVVGENPQTLYALALCHARRNEHAQAFAAARRALDVDAQHLASLKLLARMHFLRGEHHQARSLVARVLELERPPARAGCRPRGWLAALARPWRARAGGASFLEADEDRQWRPWAEAYLAASRNPDDRPC